MRDKFRQPTFGAGNPNIVTRLMILFIDTSVDSEMESATVAH